MPITREVCGVSTLHWTEYLLRSRREEEGDEEEVVLLLDEEVEGDGRVSGSSRNCNVHSPSPLPVALLMRAVSKGLNSALSTPSLDEEEEEEEEEERNAAAEGSVSGRTSTCEVSEVTVSVF